jgi:hypothetical protein
MGPYVSEEQRESFQLIDAAADLFGGVAGVTIAVAHQGITGIYEGAVVGPGVAPINPESDRQPCAHPDPHRKRRAA